MATPWTSESCGLPLAEAARRLEPFDVGLARETYLDAWGAALVAGHLAAPGGGLVEVSAAARAAPRAAMTDQGPRPADLLLEGLTTVILDGQGAATATLRQAVSTFLHDRASADEWLHWGVLAANAALALWDFDTWDGVSVRLVTLARQSGALASLAAALNIHRGVAVWAGDLERATAIGVEERVVKEVTGTQRSSGDLLLVAIRERLSAPRP